MWARIYDPAFRLRGVLPSLTGNAILRDSNVSTFETELDASSPMLDRIGPDWHIALVDYDTQLLTGTFDSFGFASGADGRTVTLAGQSHLRWLRDMITIPSPSQPVDAQAESSHYSAKGPSDTLITDLLRTHIGQSAHPSNRRPIRITPAAGSGPATTIHSRFQNVLDETRALLGDFTIRTHIDAAGLHLTVTPVADRTRSVVLSPASGSLEQWAYELRAPTVTRVLVAGQGQGASRTLRLHTGNTNQWGTNALVFQDRRDTNDTAELEKAGTEAIADGQESASITLTTTGLAHKRFGRDYNLGDRITVDVDTATISDRLQSAKLTWDATGTKTTLQVGPTPEERPGTEWVSQVHSLRAQLRRIQNT